MGAQQTIHAAVLHGTGQTPRYEPTTFPRVMGLDGVGRLADGTRVADFAPQPPYGGMAAWKTIVWEGELAADQTVLVLGATGSSGRIATQLAIRRGARGSSPPDATGASTSTRCRSPT